MTEHAGFALTSYQEEFNQATKLTPERVVDLKALASLILECHKKEGTVYFVGNGGSAAVAAHMGNDFINCLNVRSMAFTDSSVITCLANDHGYENWVFHAVKRYMKSNDLLVAISSSGNSGNIIRGVQEANRLGAETVTLTGFQPDNELRKLGKLNFWVDSAIYNIVETTHQHILSLVIHYLHSFSDKGLK